MIYLVTQQILPESDKFQIVSVEESLQILQPLTIVGVDSETSGINCHTDTLLSLQLGCFNFQVVIDCTTIDVTFYKEYLESDRLFLFWNARFDLKWLYKYKIVPYRVYDGFLAEKLMWLGYPVVLSPETWDNIKCPRYDFIPGEDTKASVPHYILYMNLKKAGQLYLGVELDKSVRGKIIWKGLCEEVIIYSADDVKYLELIKDCQEKLLEEKGLMTAMDYENRFILSLAYMEFCGIKVDVVKWKAKMAKDNERLQKSLKLMNDWFLEHEPDSKYIKVDLQGDLFLGFNTEPKVTINWNSPLQVIPIFRKYGVQVEVKDRKTKENKDSIDAKVLKPQASKCSLIPLYIEYKEASKIVSTYGQNLIDQINPSTGRLHTNFNPIGTDTARISSGGKDKINKVDYINFLNIPADSETRACFITERGNRWISIDYSGQESFIMADMANDKAMIWELMEGSKDLHSLTAKMVFLEIPRDFPVEKIGEKYHKLRSEAKGYEFAFNYAGNDTTIMRNFGLPAERAKEIYDNYMKGFSGLKRYQDIRKKDWLIKGYMDLNPMVGYKANIYDYSYLKSCQESFKSPGFWNYYRDLKESDPNSQIVQKVKYFFKRKADSDRHSVNYPIQHTGALCYKVSMINFFEYLRKNNLLFKVLITVTPYDEINCEAPEEIAENIADKLHEYMVKAGAFFVKKCKLDAKISRLENGELPNYWIH